MIIEHFQAMTDAPVDDEMSGSQLDPNVFQLMYGAPADDDQIVDRAGRVPVRLEAGLEDYDDEHAACVIGKHGGSNVWAASTTASLSTGMPSARQIGAISDWQPLL